MDSEFSAANQHTGQFLEHRQSDTGLTIIAIQLRAVSQIHVKYKLVWKPFPQPYRNVFFGDIHWNLTDLAIIKRIEIESEVFCPVSISKLKSSIDPTLLQKQEASPECIAQYI